MKSALVILSGGQDSTACLFWAKQNYDDVHAITFNYGQRHKIEIEAARKVVKLAKISSHEIIDIQDCLTSLSPLTSKVELELYSNYDSMNKVIGNRRELTFVPMRNALFLTIAANRAEAKNIKTIVTGTCQMDDANYDDCRKTFIHATEQYINTALGHDHRGTPWINIVTPLLHMTKADSVRFAVVQRGAYAALAYSHTCYAGEYPPCGKCHSCVLRAKGFSESGINDPLIERANNEKSGQ